jgi:hypothetical protein
MKTSELRNLIREEIQKALTEAYEITIEDTSDKWPEVKVTVKNDMVTLTQKINNKTSKVMLTNKQFEQLKEAYSPSKIK